MHTHTLTHALTHVKTMCIQRKRKTKSRRTDVRVELVGRRVTMMGSVWPGQDPDAKFYGVVTKSMRYKGRKGEVVNGYEVLWDDRVRERWPYDDLVVALVPLEAPLICDSDDDSDNDSESDSDGDEDMVDVFDIMTSREDPEYHEYQQMFSTSNTGEDIVIPAEHNS